MSRSAIVLAASYLVGGVPFGVLLSRALGSDLRRSGSGNPGASNAIRVLGLGAGVAVAVLDVAKGAGAALAGRAALDARAWGLAAGTAAVVGHCFSWALRGRGGRGVSTAGGAMLASFPAIGLIVVVAWVVTVLATGYASLGSLIAVAIAPAAVRLAGADWTETGLIGGMAAVIVFRHRENIGRLLAGTEPRLRAGRRSTS